MILKALAMTMKRFDISKLQHKFDVRSVLNQDHVIRFAELLEAGEKIDPPKVTIDGIVIDGRHRIEAHLLLNRTQIDCTLVKIESTADGLVQALTANLGSGLPASQRDITLTIEHLLEEGYNQTKLRETIPLPASVVRKYCNIALKKLRARRLSKAIDSITNGSTVDQAAKLFNITAEDIKAYMKPKNKRSTTIADLRGGIETKNRSMSQSASRTIQNMMNSWEDGLVSADGVRKLLDQYESGAKNYLRTVGNLRERFENLVRKL